MAIFPLPRPMRPARHRRRWLRAVLLLLAVLLLGLPVAALFVTPPSTLMLGRWLTGQLVDRHIVPLSAIAPALPAAVIAGEDGRFCQHHGVDWDAMHAVLDGSGRNGPSRGASTLAMQTAKNLFLWPGRSYLRKAIEIPLALWLDLLWPKRRMMEIYLNMAEWGDGIYGAEAAAQHYFGKPAVRLTRREAALLAAALPNPIKRNPAHPKPGLSAHAALIAGRSASSDIACLR